MGGLSKQSKPTERKADGVFFAPRCTWTDITQILTGIQYLYIIYIYIVYSIYMLDHLQYI